MGYLCPTCGEALPEDTLCPCSMDGAQEDVFFQPRWPTGLEEAMHCQGCGAAVDWREHYDPRTGQFACPECGQARPTHNASKRLRTKAGERDGWVCHRCGLPIDSTLAWPHPLAATADHYPVTRNDGGPTILANLKIAHSLCNGSNSVVDGWREGPRTDRFIFTAAQREMLDVIVNLPRDASGHVIPVGRPG